MTKMAALNAEYAGLRARLANYSAAQADTITSLRAQLADAQAAADAIKHSSFFALKDYIQLDTTDTIEQATGLKGPHIIITGANVHIRSGSGSTDDGMFTDQNASPIGLGNLVLGYNEPRWTDQPANTDLTNRGGSHNLIVGPYHQYSNIGGLIAGYWNTTSGWDASVSGGNNNTASGKFCSVSGGGGNTASGGVYMGSSSVSGGNNNTASGSYCSVSGGVDNVANDSGIPGELIAGSSVSGGHNNRASGRTNCVSGGENNTAGGGEGSGISVSGGINNTVTGYHSSISGGGNNSITGFLGQVGNTASISGGIGISLSSPIDGAWAAGGTNPNPGSPYSGTYHAP